MQLEVTAIILQTARLLKTTVVVTDRATSDAGNSISLYIFLFGGHGESQKWGSLYFALQGSFFGHFKFFNYR